MAIETGKDPEYKRVVYGRWKDKIEAIKAVPCADCGGSFPTECMDFDHIDPAQKSFNMAYGRSVGWQRVLEEIAKCRIICANCHRIRTRRQNPRAIADSRKFRNNATKTHCKAGHEFTPENTRRELSKAGPRRACRACDRAKAQASRDGARSR
jgi:hypothetical protein